MFQKSYREAGICSSGRRMSASHINHLDVEQGLAQAQRQAAVRMNRDGSGGMFSRGSRAQSHI